jgi:hypothetical protein
MVSPEIQALVSQDIQDRREQYMAIMQAHGTKTRDEIIESVRESQAELMSTFKSCADERASKSPAEGEWCMRELAQHAAFTEKLIAKLVHHMSRGETPPAEAFEGAGIGMMPKDDGRTYGSVLDELAEMNDAMLAAVRGMPDAPNVEMKLPHPFFGPLTSLEWAGFQRVHDSDHIDHARKILAAVPA